MEEKSKFFILITLIFIVGGVVTAIEFDEIAIIPVFGFFWMIAIFFGLTIF